MLLDQPSKADPATCSFEKPKAGVRVYDLKLAHLLDKLSGVPVSEKHVVPDSGRPNGTSATRKQGFHEASAHNRRIYALPVFSYEPNRPLISRSHSLSSLDQGVLSRC